MTRSRSLWRWPLFSLPLIFMALFYFYPLIKIILVSFLLPPAGPGEPDQLGRLVSNPIYGKILWFTTWQAALSTAITLILALPGAYIFAHYRFYGKNMLQALLTIPFVIPTVVTAAAFKALLGQNGLANSWLMATFNLPRPPIMIDQTVAFFLLAHVFYNYSLVLRIVGSFWAGLDPNLKGAAKLLGASPWQTFRKITLPLLLPAIGSATMLVFIFCFTSFGVILILGGPGYASLEVEIYRQAVQLFNLPVAAILSLIQIIVNFFFMWLWLHAGLGKKSAATFYTNQGTGAVKKIKTFGQKIFVGSNLLFMLTLLVTPILALLIRSITGEDGLSLVYYKALFTSQARSVFFVEPISAVVNSLGFALAAMFLAVILGLLASSFLASGKKNKTSSFWETIIMLPLVTSAVTLGFGYIITLNKAPLNLRDSIALVPIAHTLVAFPFVIRCILPSLKQIPQTLREAASMLGASPFQVWRRIDIPIISQAVVAGAVFAFSISMGEFGASAFVARPHTPTMPVAIFRFLGQPGSINYGQAMAMSSILMLITAASFWLLGKLDRKG